MPDRSQLAGATREQVVHSFKISVVQQVEEGFLPPWHKSRHPGELRRGSCPRVVGEKTAEW